LAPPSSAYGLDDEAKLMASRQAMGLAGTIPETRVSFLSEAVEPLVASPFAEPGHLRGLEDAHPRKNPLNK
jgi:hypothetical protein